MSNKKGFNDYKILGDTTLIYLTQNQITLIDTYQLQKLIDSNYRWYAYWSKGMKGYYACTMVKKLIGGKKMLQMHRFLTDCPEGLQVDHRDHSTLNNCLDNLRIVTAQENQRNRRRNSNAKSKYRGVYPNRKKFQVLIKINGKYTPFGTYPTEEEAAIAANAVMILNDYDPSCLNKIGE